ncbi:MAG: elongation factor P [Patescibacteria group bacterium]
MASTQDIKRGVVILWKNDPHLVTEFEHIMPGKGSAFVRTKLKNLKTGKVLENTFKVGEKIDLVDLEKRRVQYLYASGDKFAVMDNSTYEQFELGVEVLAGFEKYLKEGLEIILLFSDGTPITCEFPKKVSYKVTEAEPGVKGDTASGRVTKEVTLETGLKIRAPLFIKEGDLVIINTETGEYAERTTE